jgi:hypothetical protein
MYAENFRGCFYLQGVRAAIGSQLLAKSRPNPSVCLKLNNNLAVRTLPRYQYVVHKLVFLLFEVLNLYSVIQNVILLVSPPSKSLIWFQTRIIGNNIKTCFNSPFAFNLLRPNIFLDASFFSCYEEQYLTPKF